MLIAFDATAAVVLDGSAPHQLFPDDSADWLVPVGIVSYDAVAGRFQGAYAGAARAQSDRAALCRGRRRERARSGRRAQAARSADRSAGRPQQ